MAAANESQGLKIAVAVFVTLALYIRFETSFEQWLPNADQIYEVRIR